MLALSVSAVSAEQSVDVGGNTFILPPDAENIQTDANTCNFTVGNISGSILKMGHDSIKLHITSDRSRRYEVKEVTVDKYNLYRFEDCNNDERGFLTFIPKNKDNYIVKLYVPDDHSSKSADALSNERNQFIGLFKAFLVENSDNSNIVSNDIISSLPV